MARKHRRGAPSSVAGEHCPLGAAWFALCVRAGTDPSAHGVWLGCAQIRGAFSARDAEISRPGDSAIMFSAAAEVALTAACNLLNIKD